MSQSKHYGTGSGAAAGVFLRMSRRKFACLLGALLLCTLALRLYRLAVPPGYYFDEVYNASTARAYLHGEKGAYWPWTPNPPGTAYDWTHPPLARLLMAAGMKAAGENAVGWRLGSALAGTAAVALAAALALELFGSPQIALFAAFFLSLDGLSFAQARIAMNDIYFAAFALLTLWAYARWKKDRRSVGRTLFTGFCLGLAAATKWTALYLFCVVGLDLALDFFLDREAFRASLPGRAAPLLALCWLALPALMYLAAYAQFFLLGWSSGDFITLQREMWRYHTGLSGTHASQSVPPQWLLNLRPVWLYMDRPAPGLEANIYNTGNSVVYFAGLAAVAVSVRHFLLRPAHRLLLTAYFMLWAPWLFSPRIMFFYHYLPAVPFLCVLLGWLAENLQDTAAPCGFGPRRGRFLAWGLAALAFLWFAIFYPINAAVPLPERFGRLGVMTRPG